MPEENEGAIVGAKGATHLFPNWYRKGIEAKQNAIKGGKVTLNHYFPRFPKTFNVTTKKNISINDKRKTFHSFRHTFKSGLKDVGVHTSMRDDLCGHADGSAGI